MELFSKVFNFGTWTYKRYDYKGKKCIHINGLNYESHPLLHKETDKYLVIRVPGRRCWVGLGTWKYRNPMFVIFKKEENSYLTQVLEIEYRKGELSDARMNVLNFIVWERRG